MKIYIIRHGETSANRQGLLQGWTNNPLNEMGEKLAVITGEALRGVRFDAAFASPLTRSQQTAQLLLTHSGNDAVPIQIDARIKEINAGDWENARLNRLPGEIITEERLALERGMHQYFVDTFGFGGFPGGETIVGVCSRTQAFLHELAEKEYDCVLVSTHGCALRAMLNEFYEDRNDFWQGRCPYNCAVNIVEAENGKMTLTERDKIYYDSALCVDRYKEKESSR